jgi:hypothetical protein
MDMMGTGMDTMGKMHNGNDIIGMLQNGNGWNRKVT